VNNNVVVDLAAFMCHMTPGLWAPADMFVGMFFSLSKSPLFIHQEIFMYVVG